MNTKLTIIYLIALALIAVSSLLAGFACAEGSLVVDIIALGSIAWFALECARLDKIRRRYGTHKDNR